MILVHRPDTRHHGYIYIATLSFYYFYYNSLHEHLWMENLGQNSRKMHLLTAMWGQIEVDRHFWQALRTCETDWFCILTAVYILECHLILHRAHNKPGGVSSPCPPTHCDVLLSTSSSRRWTTSCTPATPADRRGGKLVKTHALHESSPGTVHLWSPSVILVLSTLRMYRRFPLSEIPPPPQPPFRPAASSKSNFTSESTSYQTINHILRSGELVENDRRRCAEPKRQQETTTPDPSLVCHSQATNSTNCQFMTVRQRSETWLSNCCGASGANTVWPTGRAAINSQILPAHIRSLSSYKD